MMGMATMERNPSFTSFSRQGNIRGLVSRSRMVTDLPVRMAVPMAPLPLSSSDQLTFRSFT